MPKLIVRPFRIEPYLVSYEAMQSFTATRTLADEDQIWLLEHPPTYTMGRAVRSQHLQVPNGFPVIQTDRGGQVTYHGPGQSIAYLLINLHRKNIQVREFVRKIEEAVLDLLQQYGVTGTRRPGSPGIYLPECHGSPKIASLGLRISRGCSYHGVALNVAMDSFAPFQHIDPCGAPGQPMTDLQRCVGHPLQIQAVAEQLAHHLTFQLG